MSMWCRDWKYFIWWWYKFKLWLQEHLKVCDVFHKMFVLHQIGDHPRGLLDSEAVKSLGLLGIFSEIISEIHHFGPLCFAELFQKIGIPKVYYTKAITTKPGLNLQTYHMLHWFSCSMLVLITSLLFLVDKTELFLSILPRIEHSWKTNGWTPPPPNDGV